MRLPRDVSGLRLSKQLESLGYVVTRQKGSHMRLTTTRNGEHHVTIPVHDPLRIGTLLSILTDVASHFGFTRDRLKEGCQEMTNAIARSKRDMLLNSTVPYSTPTASCRW